MSAVLMATVAGARADTVVHSFSETFDLSATPPGPVPSISMTWQIPKYDGPDPLVALTEVKYELTTQIFYRGVLVGIGSSTTFNLQVRSDFNFDLPTVTPDVAGLDPIISLNPTSAGPNVPFNVPGPGSEIASSSPNYLSFLAADLATYAGSGTVPVTVTGNLLTTSPGAGYHNISDTGVPNPYVFVDNAKVFPVFGLQEFSLVATMVVTYMVPEAGTWGAIGAVALLTGGIWISRRRQMDAAV